MEYENIVDVVSEIEDCLREGRGIASIRESVRGFSEEFLSIAKARISNARGKKAPDDFIFNESDLRFCTNSLVADYRASRLKCRTIIDVGCGIGIQAVAFAKKCNKVIAIECDARKLGYARMNAKVAGTDNIEFLEGDAVQILQKISSADMVFWDPERLPSEKERSLSSLKPSFADVESEAKRIGASLAVELPPQIGAEGLGACELEYISVDSRLNRLTAYFGRLRNCGISVVSLPSGSRIEYNAEEAVKRSVMEDTRKFLYDVDDAVIRAGLVFFLASSIGASVVRIGKKEYITSGVSKKSPFLKCYELLVSLPQDKAKDFLAKRGFGKVILHGSIPDAAYAKMRKGIQEGINGEKTAHIFISDGNFIVAVKR
jgi:SAM-dependent methyltransferase